MQAAFQTEASYSLNESISYGIAARARLGANELPLGEIPQPKVILGLGRFTQAWTRSCRLIAVLFPSPTIENHAQVTEALANQLARNRYLGTLRNASASELAGIIDHVLEEYARWTDGKEDELAACGDSLANTCFALSVPVVEAAYALYAIRDGLLDVTASGGGTGKNDSCRRVRRFFDLLVLQLMRRY